MNQASVGIRIRAAQCDDAAAIDRLIRHLDEFHATARPDLFRVPSGAPRGEDFLEKVLEDPDQQILVAVRRNQVVGYVHILTKTTEATELRVERRFSEIDTISVHPTAQGRGIGRKLIEAALDWTASRQVFDCQIAVHDFNVTARALYEKLGFAPSVTMLRRRG